MTLDDLKNKFDRALDSMSDSELVTAFAAMGCNVEVEDGELIKRWKPILEWSSDKVPKMDESKYIEVARLMEKYEKQHAADLIETENGGIAFSSRRSLLVRIIPQIRRNEGDVEKIILNGKVHVIIEDWDNKVAVDPYNYSEYHAFGTGYHPIGYILREDGEWVDNLHGSEVAIKGGNGD